VDNLETGLTRDILVIGSNSLLLLWRGI